MKVRWFLLVAVAAVAITARSAVSLLPARRREALSA
jgi:hypothetical protein